MSQFQDFLDEARRIVTATWRDARLGEITFRPRGETAQTVADLSTWSIVFGLAKGRVVLPLEQGRFGAPLQLDGMLVGDIFLDAPIAKSINDAFAIVRAAGHQEPMTRVVLRHVMNLGPSGSPEPTYIFDRKGVQLPLVVGAETGKLTEPAAG